MSDTRDDIFPALQLTDMCNKECGACLRDTEHPPHRLRYGDVEAYVDDLRRLSRVYRTRYQFCTGGEPTLWKDGSLDIVDVLVALHRSGLVDTLSMPTNGKVLEDVHVARDIVQRLSRRIDTPIAIGISIGKHQDNLLSEGCRALDNLLTVCTEPGIQTVAIALVTLSNDDDTSTRLSSLYPKVFQRVTPLAPLGRASSMTQKCPSVRLSGYDKSSVGSYLPHFRKEAMGKLGLSSGDFDAIPNAELINRLSLHNHCGRSFFVRRGWHYCLPLLNEPTFEMSAIGEMRPETIGRFLRDRPFLQRIRARGVVDAVEHSSRELASERRDRVDAVLSGSIPVSVAYRGCMVCHELRGNVP
jgi:hypothetical protein